MTIPRVTFVLPCTGSSGGVRVTVVMAIFLIARGYNVRIAYRSVSSFSKRLAETARLILRRWQGSKEFDWVRRFDGIKEAYSHLGDLTFLKGELVIAVGQYTVRDVYELDAAVSKLRYCHGFHDHVPEIDRFAWSVPMTTIAVSPALVPRLEHYSGAKTLAVVPNGIDTSEYFVEKGVRDGVGLIFRDLPIKGPEIAKVIVKSTTTRLLKVPWYIFGTARSPAEFARHDYCQYPSIAEARKTYNRCKIWLVTSFDEGFCLPILEAMACGCVVISSNHLVAADIIEDGVNGFIVPFGDIDAYVERIGFLLSNESERQRMVGEARKTVQRFTWDRAVAKMEETIESIARESVSSDRIPLCSR